MDTYSVTLDISYYNEITGKNNKVTLTIPVTTNNDRVELEAIKKIQDLWGELLTSHSVVKVLQIAG